MFGRRNRRGIRPDSTHRLRAEALERRDLLAGDVLVDVNGSGDIVLTGDKFPNEIAVSSVEEGVLIQGLNGTTITFQGETDDSHKITTSRTGIVDRDLTLNAGEGDDTVSVSGIDVGRTLRLDMASGNDTGNVDDVNVGAHLRLVGGANGDTFDVAHAVVTGSITANGGSGADNIEIDFTESAMAAINGGNEDDTFDIMRHNVHGGSFVVFGGNGADNMTLDPQDAVLEAFGGAGDDEIPGGR